MSFVAFGELMLRLTPDVPGTKIHSAEAFQVGFAGAEANVASSLAWLGHEVAFVTKFPDNQLGDAALSSLRSFGINTHPILRGGDRIGTYFIEIGSSIRPSSVFYDRAGSAISQIGPDEFNWSDILEDQNWLFLSGITPALSKQCATETLLAAKTAKQLGVKVAFDMNYRRTLWSDPADARTIFDKILQHTDLLFGNAGVLKDVYELESRGADETEKTEHAARLAHEKLGIDQVAFTIRENLSASRNRLSALSLVGGELQTSKTYEVEVTDRLGTGDAFAAAFLHGITRGWDQSQTLEFASAAFALKHTIRGDQHTSTEKEIQAIAAGNVFGQVLR